MKIVIANDEKKIAVAKDFSGMNRGLIAQTIMELEILRYELTEMYTDDEDTLCMRGKQE